VIITFVRSDDGTWPVRNVLYVCAPRKRLAVNGMHFEVLIDRRRDLLSIYNVTYCMMMEVTYFV
jgi:hypothetical protein